MIRAKYRREGDIHRLSLSGHAGYAEHGADIVCSAVSATIYNLLGWIENHGDELEYVDTQVESGGVSITCEGGVETATVFELTAIGLEQIAQRYPDNVAIHIVGLAD